MATLKRWQLGMLHSVPASLGIDEGQRRMIQRDLGGAESGRNMTPEGFAAVMAFYEARGWADTKNGPGFWRRAAEHSDTYRLRCKAIKLADELGWTGRYGKVDFERINGFAERMVKRPLVRLIDCSRDELNKIIEALKDMVDRQDAREVIP